MRRVPPSACPKCGDVHDAATAADLSDAVPESGDFTVCFNCGSINRFDDELHVQQVDQEALDSLDAETREMVLHASRSVERMRRFNLPMPDDEVDA